MRPRGCFPWRAIDVIISAGLQEDLNRAGDVTTAYTLDARKDGTGNLSAKAEGTLAGLPVFERVMHKVNRNIACHFTLNDGDTVSPGQAIGVVEGRLGDILTAERTALNFLQRMSGIASLAARYVLAVQGTGTKILDTRKTLPGYRWLDKYAVRCGGAFNHRFGLYDMILIKDNHIEGAGSISGAVNRCLLHMKKKKIPIEVETRNLREVQEALTLPVQRIMLDNMSISESKRAVQEIAGKVETEASGNITLRNVRRVAETGVDFISVGALTHSVPALDISLDVN